MTYWLNYTLQKNSLDLEKIKEESRFIRLQKPLRTFSEEAIRIMATLGVVLCFVSVMLMSSAIRLLQWTGRVGIGGFIIVEAVAFRMWRQSIKAEKVSTENRELLSKRLNWKQITVEIEGKYYYVPLELSPKLEYGATYLGDFIPVGSHLTTLVHQYKEKAYLYYREHEEVVIFPLTEKESFELEKIPSGSLVW